MSEISQLRKRAEAVFCRVRVFRRTDYRHQGKRIRYGFVDAHSELWASNLDELRALVERAERLADRQNGGRA